MSSTGYEALLTPARHLRLLLLATSGAATAAGVGLVLALPAVPPLKVGLCLLVAIAGAGELLSFRRGGSRIDRIGIHGDGSICGYDRRGTIHALRLLPGSVVLERVAWLRLGFQDGLAYGELLKGDPAASESWRRLLVIWRHRGGSVGRPRRS